MQVPSGRIEEFLIRFDEPHTIDGAEPLLGLLERAKRRHQSLVALRDPGGVRPLEEPRPPAAVAIAEPTRHARQGGFARCAEVRRRLGEDGDKGVEVVSMPFFALADLAPHLPESVHGARRGCPGVQFALDGGFLFLVGDVGVIDDCLER